MKAQSAVYPLHMNTDLGLHGLIKSPGIVMFICFLA